MEKELENELKDKLLKEKEDLEKEIEEMSKSGKKEKGSKSASFPNYGDQVDENAAEVEQYQTNLSVENNLEIALKDVNTALEKIKNGEYGVCENCGGEIDESRLEAFPAAKYCMRCQESKK